MFLFFLFNLSTNKYLIFHKMQNSFFSINKIFFAIFFSTIFSNQIHVNLNDPIYTFLERMYNQNQISNYNKSTMPFTKKFIIKNLNQINKNELNLIDKQLLNEYLADYDINITNHNFFKLDKSIYHPFQSKSKMLKGMKDLVIFTPNQPKNHLIIFNNNKKQLLFDIGFNTKFEMKETQTRIIYNYNYSLSIFLNKKIIIHSDANLFSMVYNSQYSEYPDQFKGGFPNYHKGFYGYETEMAFEYSNSYIQYDSEIGNFSFKKEAVIWGNGKQPIILSNNSPPITMLNWKTNLGPSSYTSFHGYILPNRLDTLGETVKADSKYLVGHRWDLILNKKMHIAFSEMLIYGGRGLEPSYLLPSIFLWPTHHNTSSAGQDNIIWFFEGEYLPIKNFKLYGTFMLDDLSISEIFNDYEDNHWAIQAGTYLTGNIFSKPIDFRFEFTAVRPWSYTHRIPLYGSYTHNGRCLGFVHGPNSQLTTIENNIWLNSRNKISISYERLIKGYEPAQDKEDEYDFGNDPNHNYRNSNSEKYKYNTGWIIGDIKTTHSIYFLLTHKLSNTITINLELNHTNNYGKYISLTSVQLDFNF